MNYIEERITESHLLSSQITALLVEKGIYFSPLLRAVAIHIHNGPCIAFSRANIDAYVARQKVAIKNLQEIPAN